jgi:hypothetical protein
VFLPQKVEVYSISSTPADAFDKIAMIRESHAFTWKIDREHITGPVLECKIKEI